MRKILSGILAAVMVALSMFNVSMAAAAQTEFTVEAEEIACNGGFIRGNGQYGGIANASGDKVLVFDSGYQSAAYTATVNAEAAGIYSVNVLANAADGSASDLTFAINGRSVKLTTASAKTAIAGSKGANGWQLYRFDSAGVVYLAKGTNELSINVGKRPGYEAYSLATLDAFEFVPCADSGLLVAENGSSTIEAEKAINISYGKIQTVDAASDKNIVYYDTGIGAANQSAGIYAEKAGLYKMNIVAGAYGASDTYSAVTVSVNGGTAKTLAAADIDSGFTGFNGYAGLPMRNFKVYDSVYLNEGLNTVAITMGARPGYPSNVLASFDSFVFEPSDKLTVSASGKSVIEAEDSIIGLTQGASAGASGGKYVYLETGYSADVTKTASFMAAQEGYYKMNIVAAAAPQNSSSYVKVSVNDAAAHGLDNDQYYSNTATDISGRYSIRLYDFAANQLVYLKEGLNTVTLTIGKRNDAPTSMLASFDSFSFEPYTIATVGENTTAAVEVEDYNRKHTKTTNERTSVAFYDAGYSSYTIEAAVKAETAGNYNMNIEAAVNDGTSSILGDLVLDINNTSVSVNNTSFTVSDLGYNYWDAAFPAKNYRKKDSVYLNEGINIIKLTITPNYARGTILAAVDKIVFAPVRTITDATISVDSVMSKGAEKNISIADQDGASISNVDAYMITYGTSDDDVVIVNGNGKISAVGLGTATVSVAIKTNEASAEIVKTAEVIVVGDEGIYVNNIQNTNGQVTFDFVSTKDYDATQVYVASYEGNRLEAVDLVDMESGAAGTVTRTAILKGYEDGQTVCILVWQDMEPVWSKVNIG